MQANLATIIIFPTTHFTIALTTLIASVYIYYIANKGKLISEEPHCTTCLTNLKGATTKTCPNCNTDIINPDNTQPFLKHKNQNLIKTSLISTILATITLIYILAFQGFHKAQHIPDYTPKKIIPQEPPILPYQEF